MECKPRAYLCWLWSKDWDYREMENKTNVKLPDPDLLKQIEEGEDS
jgi:hypothetical protein